MQNSVFVKSKKSKVLWLWIFAYVFCFVQLTDTVLAAETSRTNKSDPKPEETPIVITAERLVSDNKAKFAEFIGDVKATQADFVITSDKLRIYYAGELLNTEKKGNNQDVLKKIVATGNVQITTEKYVANTEKLEYDAASMEIILTGEDSKVAYGKDSISGSKIILYQKDGRVKVLGSKKKRIKAEFFSKGNQSNAFKVEEPKN
ncbi:MAG: LptA/OstA family protein [Desulfobacterales bacterium]